MAEKVKKVGVKRESGYLYFIDKQGDISRSVMSRGGKKKGGKPPKVTKVEKLELNKEKGYFYFIDKQGDISRSAMSRGGKKKAKKTVNKSVKKGKRK